MKRRILCMLLCAALLLGLLPLTAMPASAEGAEMAISAEAVEILKAMEGFSKYPYYDYSQYTVGYGTRCPDADYGRYATDGISVEEAETLLREYLAKEAKVLNSFAEAWGLSWNQGQFDALMLFSFNCGTGWTTSDWEIRRAVIEGRTGEDFLSVLTLWCSAGGSILPGLVKRRLCEANMYLNGAYSTTPPANYCYVLYNGNGGSVSGRIEGYDADLNHGPKATASFSGWEFAGWFTAKNGGTQVTVLDAGVSGRTLYAHWAEPAGATAPTVPATEATTAPTAPTTGATTAPTQNSSAQEPAFQPVTVTTTDDVNIRSGAGTGNSIIGLMEYGSSAEVTEVKQNGNYLWGKTEKGWICLYYTNYDSAVSGSPEIPAEKTVGYVTDTNNLRIRSGAGLSYSIVGYLTEGTRVEITQRKDSNGMTWGKISEGWISLDYVTDQPPKTETVNPEPEAAPVDSSITGSVVNASALRIRSKAGTDTDCKIVGYLYTGDKVTITETTMVDSTRWGKISQGWICMDYVQVLSDTEAPSQPAPTEPTPTEPDQTETDFQTLQGSVINASALRIRSKAGTDTDCRIVGYLYTGDQVVITETTMVDNTQWGKISQGWICMDYVQLTEGSSVTTMTVNTDYLNVRSAPGLSTTVTDCITEGTVLTVGEEVNADGYLWVKTNLGWVAKQYLK